MNTTTRKTAKTAAAACAEHQAAIEGQLRELQAAFARRFAGDAGTAVHYGHAGDLAHYSGQLGELLDQLNKTGEYAA